MGTIELIGLDRPVKRATLAEWARILELLVNAAEPLTNAQLGIKRMPAQLSGEFALVTRDWDSVFEMGTGGWMAAPYAQDILSGWLDALESGVV
jgi:hypothetical protein